MPQLNGVLEARGLHLWRGETHVLRGVSFTAAAGEAVHVSGPNGAGKTSLLRTLAGFLWPEEGEIRWNGAPVAADRDGYAGQTAYLGHENALKGDLTVWENLHYLVRLRRAVSEAEIATTLERLGLPGRAQRPVRTLSAGQRRRVAMARTVLSGAPLWLLDEPFTNLDVAATGTLCGLIEEHVAGGGIVLYTAHGAVSLAGGTRRLELA